MEILEKGPSKILPWTEENLSRSARPQDGLKEVYYLDIRGQRIFELDPEMPGPWKNLLEEKEKEGKGLEESWKSLVQDFLPYWV